MNLIDIEQGNSL
jgi:hypothetical protein